LLPKNELNNPDFFVFFAGLLGNDGRSCAGSDQTVIRWHSGVMFGDLEGTDFCGATWLALDIPVVYSKQWDETLHTTPTNIWAILLVLVCRLLPLNHLIPNDKLLNIYSPGGMLCVSASFGWCRPQNNTLSWSMPVVFTLSAFFFF